MKYKFISDKPIQNFKQTIIPENITQAYTNLIPNSLELDLWAKTNVTVVDSGDTINGERLWELETVSDGSVSRIAQVNFTDLTADSYFSFYVRYVNTNVVKATIQNTLPSNVVITITFSTKTISYGVGSELIPAVWHDDNTVQIFVAVPTTATAGSTIDAQLQVQSTGASSLAGDKVQYSQPILVDDTTTAFPFIEGSKTADVINETFTMPDQFILDLELRSLFDIETAITHIYGAWVIDGTHYLEIIYYIPSNELRLNWIDGGSLAVLRLADFFGDGITKPSVNQKLRMTISLNLSSGGINDSRFICMTLDGNFFISEDTSFQVAPDVKLSTFPTVSIGNRGGAQQADSEYEYSSIYKDLLVGAVTSSSDVDTLLQSKEIIYQASPVARENTFELNGDLTPSISRGSFARGSEEINFEQKLITRSFLSGSAKVGEARLQSRQMVFNQEFALTSDQSYDDYVNELINKAAEATYIRDTTNNKQTKIAVLNMSIPYDVGSIKRSGSISIKLEMLNAFWEDVDPTILTKFFSSVTDSIIVDNEGFLLAYPKLTFDIQDPAAQLDIFVDETKEGLQLVDSTLGTPTLTELIIDCVNGTLTIAGFDRTQNITDRTGYFPFQLGNNTLIIESPVDGKVDIEFVKRYYL